MRTKNRQISYKKIKNLKRKVNKTKRNFRCINIICQILKKTSSKEWKPSIRKTMLLMLNSTK